MFHDPDLGGFEDLETQEAVTSVQLRKSRVVPNKTHRKKREGIESKWIRNNDG